MNKEVLKFVDQIVNKVVKSDISALEVEVEGVKVRAERNFKENIIASNIADSLQLNHQEQKKAEKAAAESGDADEDEKVVKSPIVGTFYLTPSPNDKPFVKVGDRVTKGQSVCIIEAMKIMNEIESEYDGIVKEILVSGGTLVEYGQPLIVIG